MIYHLGPYRKYFGQMIKDVADQLNELAQRDHFSVNVIGYESPGNIDVEYNRLNVYLDEESRITKFSVG